MLDLVRAYPLPIIGSLFFFGFILYLFAWSELEEFNLFDIVMREGPPFEDLTGTGQLLIIASSLFLVAAVACILIVYVAPRWDQLLP
jgi:hypothetical protein